MLATLVIFLREGIEASMIVAILLAYLRQSNLEEHFRWVLAGVASALLLSFVAGTLIYLTVHSYAGTRLQTEIETFTYLLAAGVMTYMTFWMSAHSRTISSDLQGRAEAAHEQGKLSLALVAFQAVGRESLEAMVFTLAIVFSSNVRGPAIGAGLGVLASFAFAVSMYHLGKRINMARAFKGLGILLMVFSAALLVDAVQNLQELGWVNLLSHPLWNTSTFLNDKSTLGDLAHTFLGYASQPTLLQLLSYTIYLGVTVTVFNSLTRRSRRQVPTNSTISTL